MHVITELLHTLAVLGITVPKSRKALI